MTSENSTSAPSHPVRLVDVARRAGVSVATVSKALNGKDRVSEATRRRVVAAAEELAYPLDGPPSSVVQGRTGTVGLLTSDLEGRFSLPILMAAEDTFGAGSVSVFLCNARGDAIRERHYVSALLGRRVDAIMVVGSRTDPRMPIGQNLPVPVVYVYTPSSDPTDFSLTPDNVGGGRIAIQHLLDTGHSRIAHLTGPHGEHAAMDRAKGIREVLAQRGMELVYATKHGEWSEHWGRTACATLIEQGYDFDALICDSDQIARGAIDALRERAITIPDRVAVIGFDDWDSIVEGTHPPLTSVGMNLDLLGRLAAQRLFDAMEGVELPSGLVHLSCTLSVRGSTAQSI